jgi:hypothetical protein
MTGGSGLHQPQHSGIGMLEEAIHPMHALVQNRYRADVAIRRPTFERSNNFFSTHSSGVR